MMPRIAVVMSRIVPVAEMSNEYNGGRTPLSLSVARPSSVWQMPYTTQSAASRGSALPSSTSSDDNVGGEIKTSTRARQARLSRMSFCTGAEYHESKEMVWIASSVGAVATTKSLGSPGYLHRRRSPRTSKRARARWGAYCWPWQRRPYLAAMPTRSWFEYESPFPWSQATRTLHQRDARRRSVARVPSFALLYDGITSQRDEEAGYNTTAQGL